jgi:hypothetical protein
MPRRFLRTPLVAAAGALLVFLVAAVAWGIPYLQRDREAYSGTPTPPPYERVTPIALQPGDEACTSSVALETSTTVVRLLAAKATVPDVPLRVTVRAPGYRGAGVDADYAGTDPIDVTIPAPPESVLATICVRNTGDHIARLQGTVEPRIQSRPRTTLDGEEIEPRMSVLLLEGAPQSIADRPGDIVRHVAAFEPGIIGKVSLWVLAVLVLLGVPAGVAYAVGRSLRDDETST